MKRKFLTIMMIMPFLVIPVMAHADHSGSSNSTDYSEYFIPLDPLNYYGLNAEQAQELLDSEKERYREWAKNRQHRGLAYH